MLLNEDGLVPGRRRMMANEDQWPHAQVITRAADYSIMNGYVRRRMRTGMMAHDALMMTHGFGLAFNRTTFGVACLSSFTLVLFLVMAGI